MTNKLKKLLAAVLETIAAEFKDDGTIEQSNAAADALSAYVLKDASKEEENEFLEVLATWKDFQEVETIAARIEEAKAERAKAKKDAAPLLPYITRDAHKTGSIPVLNFPAIETCRADAPCFRDCYAVKLYRLRPNNLPAHRRNLEAYKQNPKFFFEYLAAVTKLDRFFRYFGAGDIPDAEFFAGMVKLANKNKGTKFLAFTKKFWIVNDYLKEHGGKLPKNLTIVFSSWGAAFPALNPFNLPVSHVVFKDERENVNIPVDAFPCAGECASCVACWKLRRGDAVEFKKH